MTLLKAAPMCSDAFIHAPLSLPNRSLCYKTFGNPIETLLFEVSPLQAPDPSRLLVHMVAAPINPSDLIPITGAYQHTINPPQVAGYEGVGIVVGAPPDYSHLVSQRVLPLRASGTWQTYIDCDPALAIPVPHDIDDRLAARAYINPLAALLMLRKWPVRDKTILLTGGGSSCTAILAQWAAKDASQVFVIYRSLQHVETLKRFGATPIRSNQTTDVETAAMKADIIFDCVGGFIGTNIMRRIKPDADFISYGLLSGQPLQHTRRSGRVQRFHIRDILEHTSIEEWQNWFIELWPRLRETKLPDVKEFELEDWKDAVNHFYSVGRGTKPMLIIE